MSSTSWVRLAPAAAILSFSALYRRMQPQLEDGEDAPSGGLLHLCQAVGVPGVQHQRLFADRVGAGAEREAAMGIVQVVGRAHADIVERPILPALQVHVPVEALELGEEGGVGKEGIDDPHGIAGVERRLQRAAGIADRLHVAPCDVAGRPDQDEVSTAHDPFATRNIPSCIRLCLRFATLPPFG